MAVDLAPYQSLLAPIDAFLGAVTPAAWLAEACRYEQLPILLIDHCNCELKAAQTAIGLVRRYALNNEQGRALLAWIKPYEDTVYRQQPLSTTAKNALLAELHPKAGFAHGQALLDKMLRLVKEELHHFEQVLAIMAERGISYCSVSAARYAKGLIQHVRAHEPATLVDKLIIGAFIEARSCERFARLAPLVDEQLGRFYISLLRSEARHYQDYLALAEQVAGADISERVAFFRAKEAALIQAPDPQFRFHSGAPQA